VSKCNAGDGADVARLLTLVILGLWHVWLVAINVQGLRCASRRTLGFLLLFLLFVRSLTVVDLLPRSRGVLRWLA